MTRGNWTRQDDAPAGKRREGRSRPLELPSAPALDDRRQRVAAGRREPAETVGAAPDRVGAIEMPAHDHAQAGAGRPARLFGELQTRAREGDGVVLTDGTVFFLTEDLVEVDVAEGDEGGSGIRTFEATTTEKPGKSRRG